MQSFVSVRVNHPFITVKKRTARARIFIPLQFHFNRAKKLHKKYETVFFIIFATLF